MLLDPRSQGTFCLPASRFSGWALQILSPVYWIPYGSGGEALGVLVVVSLPFPKGGVFEGRVM